MPKYKKNIADKLISADCVGLIKGYAWTNGGEGVIESIGKDEKLFTNKYGSNGMPDESANGMFEYAQRKGYEWGTIDTIPEIPGLAVRYNGHVGVYIGNGEVVEERGFAYGCVKTKLKDRGWLHWYKIPSIKYIENEENPSLPVIPKIHLGERLLKRGMTGEDIKELQTKLNQILHLNLVVDGNFGALTDAAVRRFQSKYSLTVDGKYGAKTHTALMSAISDDIAENTEVVEQSSTVNADNYLISNATAAIRAGNATTYAIITTINKDNKLTPVLGQDKKPILSENGWYAIQCNAQIGWIDKQYIK